MTDSTKRNIISELIKHVTDAVSPVDEESRYDDMLNDCYSFDRIGGVFEMMEPANVLKKVDQVAYRCGLNDYFGTDDTPYDIGGSYYDRADIEDAREQFVNELDDELSDLQAEYDDALTREGTDTYDQFDLMRDDIKLLQELIDKANRYSF